MTTGPGKDETARAMDSDVRAAIDTVNRRFEAAIERGDVAGAAREVYTRDCRIMPPGAPMVTGRDGAEQFWPAAVAQLGVTKVALSTDDLQVLGDAAYEVGRAALTLKNGQQVAAKFVVVWRREDGQWRWHIDIWNLDS